jgi:hypothetical protein
MQSDNLCVAYTDSFPTTLTDFRLEVAQGEKLLLLCLVNGQVAGALWLHDLVHRHDNTVSAGWIGCYFLPSYRGYPAIRLWQIAFEHWEGTGIGHFFCAVNVANRRSQVFVAMTGYFHRIGRFPDFACFHGQPADVFIYTLHTEDTGLAWQLARARAARQMLGVQA